MYRLTPAFAAIAAFSVSVAAAQQSTTSGIPGGPAATSGTRGSSAYQASGGARRGDAGRLGTNHPNAAAGPIRSSGTTQTGQARGNARNSGQLGAQPGTRPFQRVLPAVPFLPATPLDGPGLAVPGDPGAAAVEGALVAPGAGTAVPLGGEVAAPARPRVMPSFGSGPDPRDDERRPQSAGNERQIVAPLIGDLEFGLRPRAGGTASLAFLARQARLAQRAAAVANEATRERREARRPESPPAAAPSPRVQSYAGRWWHRTPAGDWLVWDASAHAWVMFHPGVLSSL
jgi:hypothetical protein